MSQKTTDQDESIHPTKPATDTQSKRVMLRAERGDTVEVDGYGEMSVVRRRTVYWGPTLILSAEDDTEYELTAPGRRHQLQLTEAVEDEDGFVIGMRVVDEVTAQLVDTKQYAMCACGEPIKNAEHERLAAFRIGEHE